MVGSRGEATGQLTSQSQRGLHRHNFNFRKKKKTNMPNHPEWHKLVLDNEEKLTDDYFSSPP